MVRFKRIAGIGLIAALCCSVAPGPPAFAQTRMNDKDVEGIMRNLRDDTKKFRSSFHSAIGKSSIRKTSQEKDAKDLVARFEKQTDGMLDHSKDRKKAELELQAALSTAEHIDTVFADVSLGGKTASDWRKVRSELARLSDAFGIAGGPSR
jgi:hypothetical protein